MRLSSHILRTLAPQWLLVGAVGSLVWWGAQETRRDAALIAHLQHEDKTLQEVLKHIVDLETGVRGFVITGEENFLEPYRSATSALPRDFQRLQALQQDHQGDPERARWRGAQAANVQRLLEQWQRTVAVPEIEARAVDPEEAGRIVKSGRGKRLTDQIRQHIAAMQDNLHAELRRHERHAALTLQTVQYLTPLALLVLLGASVTVALRLAGRLGRLLGQLEQSTRRLAQGDLNQRAADSHIEEAHQLAVHFNHMAAALQHAQHEALERHTALQQRNEEAQGLAQLSDTLQACYTLDEGFSALRHGLPHLFPGWSGAIAVISASRNLTEVRVRWGSAAWTTQDVTSTPDQCWALRRGGPYGTDGPMSMPCAQHSPDHHHGYLCIPLVAQGEAVGTLRLAADKADLPPQQLLATREYALSVSRQVALAITNLQLRDTLRNQSVRDPLTQLFNRRYLEETLPREVRRAQRDQTSLSVLALDVDHFKRFNDTFGHEGGDAMLQAVARRMQDFFRAEDILCRYGGEEFVVLLPDTSGADASIRADAFRESVSRLSVLHEGVPLGQVTVSLGLAVYPDDARDEKQLVALADRALYESKRAGRNRVTRATPGLPAQTTP